MVVLASTTVASVKLGDGCSSTTPNQDLVFPIPKKAKVIVHRFEHR